MPWRDDVSPGSGLTTVRAKENVHMGNDMFSH